MQLGRFMPRLLRSDGQVALFGDNTGGQCTPPELEKPHFEANCDPWPAAVFTLIQEPSGLYAQAASGQRLLLQPRLLKLLRRSLAARALVWPFRARFDRLFMVLMFLDLFQGQISIESDATCARFGM